jgi:hypothetical protein
MRLIVIISVVVGIAAGVASADLLRLTASKDTAVGTYDDPDPLSGEGHTNYGATSHFLGLQSWYIGIYDFNVHQQTSGALHDWMVANLPTYAATGAGAKQAIADGVLTVQFGIAQRSTNWAGKTGGVSTITVPSGTWSEGDRNSNGSIDNDGNWGSGTAATYYNPNDKLPADGGFLGLGWGTAGDQNLRYVTEGVVTNSTNMTGWSATVADSYALVALDGTLVQALLDDPHTVGLRLKGTGANNSQHSWYRENGDATAPELVFSVVPEPATMALLLIGGLPVLALRRRKR